MKRAADATLRLVAAALFASLIVTAWHDVSKAFDGWYYHLPFAARIAGIVGPDTYVFSRANAARFGGFPLLVEAVQGALWRVTGRVECVNFVSLAPIPALAWALRRMWGVPLHLTVLALLGVPLVQIHATANYVDLPANACATGLLLVACRAVVSGEVSIRALAIGAALAAATVNAKFQLVPIAVVGSLPLVVLALKKDALRTKRLALVALAMPLVFAIPLKNAIVHHNPVWPVQLLSLSLPHVERAYSSSPDWLEHAPRPVRFACSVLEIGLRPIASHRRWSLDQWTPPSETGYRMGGFDGIYVVVNLAALAWAVVRQRTREAKTIGAFALGLTLVTSVLPQSHELRYYLVWMLFLLSANLILWSREKSVTVGLVALAAVAIVGWSTEGTYLLPTGDPFAKFLASRVDMAAVSRIPDGARVCIMREPNTFLYAPLFHAPKRYVVQEAEDEADCAGAPLGP